ncbi:glycerol-3-phosphate dehydrogenase/oxidase [Microbacterium luteolum]|uniref:Glycerol-3-phosphate dehydrogenase/oxidase n=1 Tax=Microbacterium luteolum TaxID=69367 RepID=A0ABY7XJC3_MICLT|nr:glycerol-3-phosphate dehydrogenase/oxidase [Microbacterium luteolum]WDM42195.1 glycerol-3-phosphate dehydrogenase/oxidase [Microbacterium luteolum]
MNAARSARFDSIRADGAFDAIVVGGGINGVGAFRELSLQGLRVLLVERVDFCSGCSAAPSRMIHGGLRYLENGEFGLVRESLRERDALLRNAPHMVRPLATVVPITSVFSGLFNAAASFFRLSTRPASRGAVPLRIGLSIYDWVTRTRRMLPRHRFLGTRAAFRRWPKLTSRMKFAAVFYDAWISYPERLGVELIVDTARMAPDSVALNYAEIVSDGSGFVVTDSETGTRYPVTTKTVVNATGAWLDESLSTLLPAGDRPGQLVEGTKGSHLVLDNPELYAALDGHMVYFDNSDGRICIAFGYLGRVLAGSTDIKVERAERVRCEDDERDYILGSLQAVFPAVTMSADQIVYSFSGIRPLLKSEHDFTGRITRGHDVKRIDGDVPQYCMIGGKWTTFRAFAQDLADEVLEELGRERTTSTAELGIGGGADFVDAPQIETALIAEWGVSEDRAAHLADVYGTRAAEVMEFCTARDDDQPIGPGVALTAAEVAFMVHREYATRLGDLILRRTAVAITGAVDARLIEAIATVAAAELDWNDERRLAEIGELVTDLEDYHRVDRDALDRRTMERTL